MWSEYGYGACPGFFSSGIALTILWWLLIIIAIVTLVRWLRKQEGDTSPNHGKALNILRERYAKGEIDKSEFEEKKKDLVS